jgi:hypothetical protein
MISIIENTHSVSSHAQLQADERCLMTRAPSVQFACSGVAELGT